MMDSPYVHSQNASVLDKTVFYELIRSLQNEYERLWTEVQTGGPQCKPCGLSNMTLEEGNCQDVPMLEVLHQPRQAHDVFFFNEDAVDAHAPELNGRWQQSEVRCGRGSQESILQLRFSGDVTQFQDNDTVASGEHPDSRQQSKSSTASIELQKNSKRSVLEMDMEDAPSDIKTAIDCYSSAVGTREIFDIRGLWQEHQDVFQEKLCGMAGSFGVDAMVQDFAFLKKSVRQTGYSQPSALPGYSYIIHPKSKIPLVWHFLAFTLLSYDLVMVPVETCFTLETDTLMLVIRWGALIFWTLDIGMTFICGVMLDGKLVMEPKYIALNYLKGWFLLDVSIVAVEWLTELLEQATPASFVRLLRWPRLVRMLRIARLIRRQVARNFLPIQQSSAAWDLCENCLKTSFVLLLGVHWLACLWHLVGDSNDEGWVSQGGVKDATVLRKYSLSVNWLFTHVPSDEMTPGTSIESLLDAGLYLCFIVLMAHCLAAMIHVILSKTTTASQARSLASKFIKRNKLSFEMAHRLEQCVSGKHHGGAADILATERALIESIPESVQYDIHFEVRSTLMQKTVFFADMTLATPRVLRTLTHHMGMLVAVQGELVFVCGDACNHMLFLSKGECVYEATEDILVETPRSELRPRHAKSGMGRDFLYRGDVLSEAVLWVMWEHHGELRPEIDCLTLSMDAAVFAREVSLHRRATVHAVKYAKHFIWHMNRSAVSDVMSLDLDMETVDKDLHIGGLESHFAFISHYKVEAGTEATLMKDEMETIIHKDPSNMACDYMSPVFIDSEDLVDLGDLMNHVRGSLALIVILTPGVLSRPWCLLEIVTAWKCGRPFVPVLLLKPGSTYHFPDEEFYAKLRRDEVIGAEGKKILEDNATNLEEVEVAIRAIFMMIALPFSPHKSAAVREAEIKDIIKRCKKVILSGEFLHQEPRSSSPSQGIHHSLSKSASPCMASSRLHRSTRRSFRKI